MKRPILFVLLSVSALSAEESGVVRISTKNVELVFQKGTRGDLAQVYLGPREQSPRSLPEPKAPDAAGYGDPDPGSAYPGGGSTFIGKAAVRARHADGNTSTVLSYVGHRTTEEADGLLTKVELKDAHYDFHVDLMFRARTAEDVIEQWAVIRNEEEGEVLLQDFASASLVFTGDLWLTHFHGGWANEMNPVETKLDPGTKLVENRYGTMGNLYVAPHFLLGIGGPAREREGTVLMGSLAWSGNFALNFETGPTGKVRLNAGVHSESAERHLAPGESFVTPPLLYTLSTKGTGEGSRNLHRWARKYGMHHAGKPQQVLNNNWEATGFDFDEGKIVEIMRATKDLGAELFLLDDGWFANDANARVNDQAGLGDWLPNRKRLPHGLKPLVEESEKLGLAFGIWVEPEMVNVKSDLYAKHPEWVVTQQHRPLSFRRNQLVLDMSRPEVQEHAFRCIDETLKSAPGTAYLKWDCNSYITNPGSSYLSADRQSHLPVDFIRGVYAVMDRVADAYPELTVMVCSGGGGRVDYGSLSRFQQFWPSDNTDPLRRIPMQHAYSYFFPAEAISAHVTHAGKRPMKFAFDVAMSARLGMDLDPRKMSAEELAVSKQAIDLYKNRLREVVQGGDLYRLEDPSGGPRSSLSYVSEDKRKAALFAWLIADESTDALKLEGLDPAGNYRIEEVNLTPGKTSALEMQGTFASGASLMSGGLKLPIRRAFESTVILLEAE
ncbi:alpha-galactosidase [Luteolibacter luteus]|uniref:Alpha-galactosidase n=1 Tax=Luteolibacter luteus TaxID=2728835 RepID=A0A858RI08_9BACT|nr:alpha-galactosidase [Luteolibacter luteus]QJE95713.1 alpha-galactosidase [Luteolibacter luteus]